MRLASVGGISFKERQVFRMFRGKKRVYQFFHYKRGVKKTVVFIVGCQRSGTSMMHHLFRLDLRTVTYDEVSALSSNDQLEHLRFNALPQIKSRILSDRSPLVVTKPLVESQNLKPLLDLFPETRAIWMYRHFLDVASSNMKFFSKSTGFSDLSPILKRDSHNWRSQNLHEEYIQAIESVMSSDTKPPDAAALFWYARNSLFFSGNFEGDQRVALCCYGDLVTKPEKVMQQAYKFVGHEYPGERIIKDVFSQSHGKGKETQLSSPVRHLCEDMWQRLNNFKAKQGIIT